MTTIVYEHDLPTNDLEALRKYHLLNRHILEHARDCFAIHNPSDLSYQYLNPAATKLLGYSQEELLGRSALDFIHPDDVERVFTTLANKLFLGKGQMEFRYLKKDGSFIWLEVTATLLPPDAGYEAMIILSRDATERKQAKADLQKSYDELALKLQEQTAQNNQLQERLQAQNMELMRTEQRLQETEKYYWTLFKNAGIATMIVDKDLKIVAANQQLAELTGYSLGELIGMNPFEQLVSPEYLPIVQENYRRRLLEPAQVPTEYAIDGRDKHGNIRKMIMNVAHVSDSDRHVVSIRDVTEQHRAELRLKASEERFRALFEQAPVGIVIDRKGRTLLANQTYATLHGYDCASELAGIPVLRQTAPGCHRTVRQGMKKLAKGSISLAMQEIVRLRKDGSTFPARVQVNQIVLPDGPANVAFVTDVTPQKQAEADLQRQMEALVLLLEIGKNLANIVADEIDDAITASLQIIGEFDESDCSFIFLLSDDGSKVESAYEWCAEGITAQIKNCQNIPAAEFSWWMDTMRRLENLYIVTVDDLPSASRREKELLQALSVQSLIVVPMVDEGNLVGFAGFYSAKKVKTWSVQNITILEAAAQIFTRALRRKKYMQNLQDSENYYRTIFENTGGATIIIEEDLSISMVNQEFEREFGYSREDLHNKPWTDLFINDTILKDMKEYHHLRRIDPASAPSLYFCHLRDAHGKNRDGMIHVALIPGTAKSVVTFIDFTEFNRVDRALKAISSVNSAMIQAENEQDLLSNICQGIVEAAGYSLAWVGFVAVEQPQSVWPMVCAGKDNGYLNKVKIDLQDPKCGRGPIAAAIRSRKPVIARDFKKHCELPWLKEALRQGFQSMMAIPLIADQKVFGALSIYSNVTDAFDKEEEKLLVDMANNLAYAVMSLRHRAQKNQTAQELETSLDKMQRILMQAVTSLGTTLDIRDPYTSGHQRKAARLAAAIGAEMGLEADAIEGISVAGNLHDIGKINVPSEILSKPGKITEMEFGIIKTHCQAGYDIVKEIEFPWPVADIILQHHERMNGSGYPRGIKGEEIIREARIMAVADVVEAMASHRPYRPALGMDIALEEISKNSGILYDPEVVTACVRLVQEHGFLF